MHAIELYEPRRNDPGRKIRTVHEQDVQGHEQEQKRHVVGVADTVCDPVAVVVHPCDAAAAETAVLATGWFGDPAGAADVVGVEDDVVVGVGVLVSGGGGGDG